MCVIIQVPKGIVLPHQKFENAVLNNPDGWGLVLNDRGKLMVRKEFDEKGNDPDVIAKALEGSIDFDRYLHVRKNTVGKNSVENSHPFTVFNSGGNRIEFMHNGTFHSWKPPVVSEHSDTRNFAEKFLSPLLYHWHGEAGLGDYSDPFFKVIAGKEFSAMNVGLLISNHLPILELGGWEDAKLSDEVTVRASNNSYFNTVTTTRLHESRRPTQVQGSTFRGEAEQSVDKTREKAATAAEVHTSKKNSEKIAELREVNLDKMNGNFLTVEDIDSLLGYSLGEFDNLTEEELSYFTYLTKHEFMAWANSKPNAAGLLLEGVFLKYAELVEEYEAVDEAKQKITEKHETATKMIADITTRNNAQAGVIGRLTVELANLKTKLASLEKEERKAA